MSNRMSFASCHPEFVSALISTLNPLIAVARWVLNQVQHDDDGEANRNPFATLRLRVNQT